MCRYIYITYNINITYDKCASMLCSIKSVSPCNNDYKQNKVIIRGYDNHLVLAFCRIF